MNEQLRPDACDMDLRDVNYVLNPFVGDIQTLRTNLSVAECTDRLNEIIECDDRDHPTSRMLKNGPVSELVGHRE